MNKDYVYTYSREAAEHNGDLEVWRRSYAENIACAKEIHEEIARSFDGYHLDKDAAKRVIGKYGYDRTNWVMAATVQQKDYDGRFSCSNKEWSNDHFMGYLKEERQAYLVDSHPAVLDGFINQARRAYQELGLFDRKHCVADTNRQNFDGRVLVLDPTTLGDEYKSPENQLVLCTGGFGASPEASGRRVFGVFLSDGERCQHTRSDFMGVLDDVHMPDWAHEKLEQFVQKEPDIAPTEQHVCEEDSGFTMEME